MGLGTDEQCQTYMDQKVSGSWLNKETVIKAWGLKNWYIYIFLGKGMGVEKMFVFLD